MGTTFLAVAVLVAPFLGRLLPAYRAGRWGGVKKALRSASLYTATVWAALFLIGMARFIYKGHIDLLAANTKLSADLQKVKDKERAGDDQQLREQLKRAHSEAQHWHDAYLRISRGETRPDRILNSEEANTLYEELRRISKDARNKDFIKLDFGVVQDREASHLAIQLFKIFKEAHWNVTWKKIPAGKQWPKEFEFIYLAPAGVTIWTDQPNNIGTFLMSSFKNAGLDATVNPAAVPPGLKGTLVRVGYKQFP